MDFFCVLKKHSRNIQITYLTFSENVMRTLRKPSFLLFPGTFFKNVLLCYLTPFLERNENIFSLAG